MAQVDKLLIIPGINVLTKKFDSPNRRNENTSTDDINPVDIWYLEERFYRDEETRELARKYFA